MTTFAKKVMVLSLDDGGDVWFLPYSITGTQTQFDEGLHVSTAKEHAENFSDVIGAISEDEPAINYLKSLVWDEIENLSL